MQKAWQAWTFVPKKVWPTRSRWGGRGDDATDCASVGFEAIWAGGFLPVGAVEVVKPWQARTFAVAEPASSMTLKS